MMLEAIGAGYAAGAVWLVRELNVAVPAKRVTALVGPNGAGKSTAMRLLAGVLRPTAGRVLVDGTPIESLPRPAVARCVSYVPQVLAHGAAFTVQESVAMGRYCHRGRFQGERPEDRRAVRTALEVTDCAHLADRFVGELSGGEQRRVALARGLATEAQHLLLDEPTANLDIEHSLAILDLVQQVAKEGRSVLLALHDLNSVLATADRIYVLHGGTVRATGQPEIVLTADTVREVFAVRVELLGGSDAATLRFARLGQSK